MAETRQQQRSRIIQNAYDGSKIHGRTWGDAGVAAAAFYREVAPSAEELLYMIAMMADGLAYLEPSSTHKHGSAE